MKVKSESEVAQSCLTLRDPMDCNLPGSSIHGIFQARVLEWGAIAFSNLSTVCLKSQQTGSCLSFILSLFTYLSHILIQDYVVAPSFLLFPNSFSQCDYVRTRHSLSCHSSFNNYGNESYICIIRGSLHILFNYTHTAPHPKFLCSFLGLSVFAPCLSCINVIPVKN